MKRRNISVVLALTLTLALLLSACGNSGKEDSSGEQTKSSGGVFGIFESETLDGETVTQDVFKQADLTMVNIWATYCGPCIEEMPGLGELSREYADKGVQIIGLVSDVDEPGDETAVEIVTKTKADYMNIVASPHLQLGILSEVSVVPTTIFVDKDGKQVGDVYAGGRAKEDWADIIDVLLSEVQ